MSNSESQEQKHLSAPENLADVIRVDDTFDTTWFTKNKLANDRRLSEKVDLIRQSCAVIARALVTGDGIDIIQRKITEAEQRGKNSTNIFETDLCRRMVHVKGGGVMEITATDIDNGFIDYPFNDEIIRMEIDRNSGISMVDLIKGPIGMENWMRENNLKTLPEILQDIFRDKQRKDMMDNILEEINSSTSNKKTEASFSNDEWDVMINEYMARHKIIVPTVYVHYNRRWGNPRRRGKFAIELDWSGENPEKHGGILAGEYGKSKNAKSSYKGIKTRRRTRRNNRNLETNQESRQREQSKGKETQSR